MSTEKFYPYQVIAARAWRFLHRYEDTLRVDAFANEGEAFLLGEDCLHAAFQCCWHIRDWIKHDQSIPEEQRKAIEQAIYYQSSLLLAQGYANGTKHLELNDRRNLVVDDGEVEMLTDAVSVKIVVV